MEVRCSNCATEYELDDALVSARGTSVKCTQCGHQFRVHPRGASAAPETWLVRKASGREAVFTSLRELQQAIVKGQLEPDDQLSRGGQPFRPLEDIYELQTFFTAAQGSRPRPGGAGTLLGVGHQGRGGSSQVPRGPRRSDTEPVPIVNDRKTPVAPVPPGVVDRESFFPPPSAPGVAPPPSQARPAISSVPPARGEDWSEAEDGSRRSSPPPAAPLPWQNLEGLRVRDGETADLRPTGGARSRWILALVLLGG